MKLRSKRGTVVYYVTNADGRQWRVKPRDYLTRKQARKMACIPDMILQFAHHLGETWEARGHTGVTVTANVRCSLNGRRKVQFVDAQTDLYAEARHLGHVEWILPLTEPLRSPWLASRNEH